jgi:hypothetical protein
MESTPVILAFMFASFILGWLASIVFEYQRSHKETSQPKPVQSEPQWNPDAKPTWYTIKGWLETLPEPYAKICLAYTPNSIWGMAASSAQSAVVQGILWNDTPDPDFFCELHNALITINPNLPPISKVLEDSVLCK